MKTYRAATYLKVVDVSDSERLCCLLKEMATSVADDTEGVDVDEVRVMPSVGGIRVAFRVEAASVAQAAETASDVLDRTLNLLPGEREGLLRRHSELAYT